MAPHDPPRLGRAQPDRAPERSGAHEVLGETIDDAAGEAYDKIARWLGLGYPGGPEIDRLAQQGTAGTLKLPISMTGDDYDLSFSGLKTAVVRATQKSEVSLADVAASFQAAVAEQLLRKLRGALEHHPVKGLALAGGVAANSALRSGIIELAGSSVWWPTCRRWPCAPTTPR